MAISKRILKKHIGDISGKSGEAFRAGLAKSFEKTEIGKKHNLHRTRGVSPKERDKRLKATLQDIGAEEGDIKKIYAANKSPVKDGGKIAESIFGEVGKGVAKRYQEKHILESVDSFAGADSEKEFKTERQGRSNGWSGLFKRKKREIRGEGPASMKEQQMSAAVSDSVGSDKEDGDNGIKLQTQQTHLLQVKTKLDEDSNEDIDHPHSPLPRTNINLKR
ncbi:MAG: hypothetical protein ABIA91_02405 [Patescibacteria group bacterium]